ncbi:MAG: aspartate kinase [Mangrovibacterium sp.]
MKVFKFGGTSVGSVENMNAVMKLVTDGESKIVVLSAMSGTTNALVEIATYLANKNKEAASTKIAALETNYDQVVNSLLKGEYKSAGELAIKNAFNTIRQQTMGEFNIEVDTKTILAQGELISTALFTQLMLSHGHNTKLIPALDFMRIDEDKSADAHTISPLLEKTIKQAGHANYYVTQGFICRNHLNEIDNLQRGGSDYTASLIGAAIESEEVQIWTDIDGFHNNDPRFVEGTKKVEQLSFNEAAELAYFGAKILHPQTVLPAKLYNIPVRLKNTMNPSDSGTLITRESSGSGIKAVAAKDGIIAIKIRSYRMLMAYGFMRTIFDIFEKHKTPVDMVTTSEVAVSLTIDNTDHLNKIVEELKHFAQVEVDSNMSIVCIVGDIISEENHFASKVFTALENIPVRMISYGGSRHNISILVSTENKKCTLQALSDKILPHA